MSEYGVISGPYFSVFSPNKGKYAPEITPYLDAFHVVFSKMFQVILDSKTNSSQAPQERVVLKNFVKLLDKNFRDGVTRPRWENGT